MRQESNQGPAATRLGAMIRPEIWRRQDRHVSLAISHTSQDPALHRTYQLRAAYNTESGGWFAMVSEQNYNDQFGEWSALPEQDDAGFPSASACIGWATTCILDDCDRQDLMD